MTTSGGALLERPAGWTAEKLGSVSVVRDDWKSSPCMLHVFIHRPPRCILVLSSDGNMVKLCPNFKEIHHSRISHQWVGHYMPRSTSTLLTHIHMWNIK
jgi:hypothetical protein